MENIYCYEGARKIYKKCGDAISKKIFLNRLRYSITRDKFDMLQMPTFCYEWKDVSNTGTSKIEKMINDAIAENAIEKITIFGAGTSGKMMAVFMDRTGYLEKYEVAFCDNNDKLWESRCYYDEQKALEVMAPLKLKENAEKSLVIISTENDSVNASIEKQVTNMGIGKEKIIRRFNPILSQQYFDLEVLERTKDEVLVDIGCFDGMNSKAFAKWSNYKYNSIIAFESDPVSFAKCENNFKEWAIPRVTLESYGIWSSNQILRFKSAPDGDELGSKIDTAGEMKIKVVSLDSYLKGRPVTFIKMDIEGAELEALKGMKETIKNYHPKLAISVYHKQWDILELPEFICDTDDTYQLFFRHYTCDPSETVMYAV